MKINKTVYILNKYNNFINKPKAYDSLDKAYKQMQQEYIYLLNTCKSRIEYSNICSRSASVSSLEDGGNETVWEVTGCKIL